jgi:hypothetical protein
VVIAVSAAKPSASGAAAAGIALMAIARRADRAPRDRSGRPRGLRPALHVVLLLAAIATVPASIAILDVLFEGLRCFTAASRAVLIVRCRRWRHAARGARRRRTRGPFARLSNLPARPGPLAIALSPLIFDIGWAPFAFGVGLSACALAVGAACAGRDPGVRRAGAVAAAMRNPGLALLIAAVNEMPALVVAAVFDYAIGLTLVITAFILWPKRAA